MNPIWSIWKGFFNLHDALRARFGNLCLLQIRCLARDFGIPWTSAHPKIQPWSPDPTDPTDPALWDDKKDTKNEPRAKIIDHSSDLKIGWRIGWGLGLIPCHVRATSVMGPSGTTTLRMNNSRTSGPTSMPPKKRNCIVCMAGNHQIFLKPHWF